MKKIILSLTALVSAIAICLSIYTHQNIKNSSNLVSQNVEAMADLHWYLSQICCICEGNVSVCYADPGDTYAMYLGNAYPRDYCPWWGSTMYPLEGENGGCWVLIH